MFPASVKLVEVSPRDGLQNESKIIPTEIKIQFINLLSESGLKVIEATSFVSPKWIPQLADHREVFLSINKNPQVKYLALVPNKKGFENALTAGVKEIAVFTSPSEIFNQHNLHSSTEKSLKNISEVIALSKPYNIPVRGYISCVLGCPYEGEISPIRVTELAEKLINMGCEEISLGDTIGIGTPKKTTLLLRSIIEKIPIEKIAVHFHDTYGQALTNIYVALENGIHIIDSSVAGLGGCPYAKGASGNVATEDVLYMLNGLGIDTGVSLEKLIHASHFIMQYLNRESRSKVGVAKS